MTDFKDPPPINIQIGTAIAAGQFAAEEFVSELPEDRFAECKGRFIGLLADTIAFSDIDKGSFEFSTDWQYFVLHGHFPSDGEAKVFWFEMGRENHGLELVLGFNRGLLSLFG